MANLYEILTEAQNGEALADIGREYGLTPEETDAAVAALLPAVSMGLKRSTISRARREYSAYSLEWPGRNTACGASLVASRIDMPERTPNARAS